MLFNPRHPDALTPRVARRLGGTGASLAVHVAIGLALAWATGPLSLPAGGGDPGGTITMVQVGDTIPFNSRQSSAPSAGDPAPDDLGIRVGQDGAHLSLPGFSLDYSVIANRPTLLFPFLTGRVALERLVAARDRDRRTGLVNPFGTRRAAGSKKPPLVLTDAARDALLDRTWSRRDRWTAFRPIAELTGAYSGEAGALPEVLREYVDRNGLQPYVDTAIRDPRLWTHLGLAANHLDFIDFISRYASEHPSTKATTELLFLLEKLAQGSFDALAALLDTDPATDLAWTRTANRYAYDMLGTIRDYYRKELEKRDLDGPGALKGYYHAARLAILTTILETTPEGYRAADARFLMGAIYWKENRREDAIEAWRALRTDPADTYVIASSQILAELSAAPARPLNPRRISSILENENGRWVMASFDRLRKFGYRFDTY